eukprot:3047337-Pyramimonas_sp.AAC.1
MGRWQSAVKEDGSLKSGYGNIAAGPGINERKSDFRSKWAKGEYQSLMDHGLEQRPTIHPP